MYRIMSGISNYTLNQKINAILGKTSGLPSVIDLDTTLTTGNNAGANDIDMNNNDILQVNNIDLTTINGGAYPPSGVLYPYLNVAFLFSVASTYQTFTINRIVPNLTLGNPPNTTTSSRGTWTLTDTGYIVPDTGRYSISFSATSQGAVLWAWYIVVNGTNGTATFDANNGAIIRYISSRACNLGISTLTLTAGDIVGIKGTDSPTITQGQYWFNIAYIGA